MRLTLVFDVKDYPTLDGYKVLLGDVETKTVVCVDIVEEETTVDVLRELGRR